MKTQLRTFLQRSVATILSVIQIALLCVSGVASAPQTASAAIPSTVGYQGRLKSASGSFLTGTYSFTFRIYDDLTAGTLLWSETQPTVTVESGVFIVRLGSVTPFLTTLDFNQPLFLATEVNSDGEMSPRVTINSVPYAYTAGGVSSNPVAPTSTVAGGRMFYNTSDGTLQYYDDTLSVWRTLGTSTATAETFQSVTNRGTATTNAIQFAGGTSTGAFAVSNTLTVTGSSSLQNLTFTSATGGSIAATNGNFTNLFVSSLTPTNLVWTNATGTNTTSTNLFATNSTISNFNSSNVTISGGTLNGVSIGLTTPGAAIFTNVTSTSVTSTNSFATNFGATNATIQNLTLTAPLAVSGLIWTNATGTNTTSTNLFATNLFGTAAVLANVTSTSLFATNLGATTGTITNLVSTNGSIATLATTSLTATNATATTQFVSSLNFTSGTSTGWLGFNVASGSSLFVQGQAVCLANGTNCPSVSSESDTLLSVTNRGAIATSTLTLYGGATVSNLTVTDTSNLQNTTFTNATGTSLIVTNTTSTNNNATNLTATNATVTTLSVTTLSAANFSPTNITWVNATGTNTTSTNLFATNNSFVNSIGTSATTTNSFTTNGTVTNLGSTNGTITSLAFTSATGTNFSAASGTVTALTSTSVTTTSMFASAITFVNATSSGSLNFNSASGSSLFVQGQAVCLANGTNCPSSTAASFQTVTNAGNTTTNAIQFAGGTSTRAFAITNNLSVTGTLTVSGASSLQGVTLANATATNVTTTNLGVLGSVDTALVPSVDAALALGSSSLRWNAFFGNVTSTNATTTNLFVTNLTATAASLASGTVTSLSFTSATGANFLATSGTISSLRASSVTTTNFLTTNATTSNLTFTNGTGTNLFVANTSFTNSTSTNLFATTAAFTNLLISSLNVTSSVPSSFTNLIWTNATGTNTTSTNLFAVNFGATNATLSSLNVANGTSTGWFNFNNASGSSLFVQGQAVCLANGTNCLNSAAANLQSITDSGNTTTNAIQFAGGTSTATFETSALVVDGGSGAVGDFGGFPTKALILQPDGNTWSVVYQNANADSLVPTSTSQWAQYVADDGVFEMWSTNFSGGATHRFYALITPEQKAAAGESDPGGIYLTEAGMTLSPYISNANDLGLPTASWRNIYASGTASTLYGANFTQTTTTNATTTNLFATRALFTNATSTGIFNFNAASGTSLSLNGQQICLANGTNCPSSPLTNLQTVTNAGNTTTNAIQFAGGTSTGNFVPSTDAALSLGSSGLRWNGNFANLSGTSLSFVSATGTNFFASSGTVTNLTATNATFTTFAVTGNAPIAFANITWTNATGTNTTSTNLFATNFGATTGTITNVIANAVTSTSIFATSGGYTTLNVSGASVLGTLTATAATATTLFASSASFTNATSTGWFGFNTASGSNLFVNGQAVCLVNGTNCPSGTSPNFQTVTNSGNTTTNAIQFAGGTSTGNFVPSTDATLSFGSPALRWNGNFANLTGTSLSFVSATGTNFLATSGTITNLIASSVTSTNVGTTNLTATNATFTTFVVTGSAPISFANLTWTNATGTNTTSTNLFATNSFFTNSSGSNVTTTNLFATTAAITSVNFGNGTSTGVLSFNTASGSALFVQGQAVCLANGMNCPSGTSPNFQTVTNGGNTTTNAIQFAGGTSTGNFLPSTDAALSLGSSGLRWNGNFANLSGTSLSFVSATGTNFLATSGTITSLTAGNVTASNVTSTNAATTNLTATNATFTTFAVTGNAPIAFANITWTNATGTNTTSTNLFATNFGATTGTITNVIASAVTSTSIFATSGGYTTLNVSGAANLGTLTAAAATATTLFGSSLSFTNGTSTGWFGFNTASGSSLFVQGQAVCLQNGTNCAVPAEVDTLLSVTNRGAVATSSVTFYGGITTSNLTVTGTETIAGNLRIGGSITTTTFIGFTTSTAKPTYAEGLFFYDNTEKSLAYYNDEPTVTMNIGQENWIRVRNQTGSTIPNGSLVYIVGAASAIPTVALARADASSTSDVIGMATHDILNNGTGYITAFGTVHDLNTAAFPAGGSIYLSPSSAGGFTATRPSTPNLTVRIGVISQQSSTSGAVLIQLGAPRGGASTPGAVAFGDASGFSAVDGSNFFWDNIAKRLQVTNVTSSNATISTLSFTNGTSTSWFGFGTASGSSLFVQGQNVCLQNGLNCPALAPSVEVDTLLSVTNRGSVATATVTLFGGLTTANLTATGTTNLQATTFTAGTGTSLFVTTLGTTTGTATSFTTTNLVATNSVITNATSTNQFVSNLVSTAATSTNAFASSLLFTSGTSTSWLGFNTASGSSLIVNGQNVCLQNGTNCPASTGGPNFWSFDNTNDAVYPATSTSDLHIGGATRSTAAFSFLTANTSSRMYVGAFGSSTNIVLGGPTSTVSNTAFQLSGGSMFASGSFGSASSVYTNGAFIAATTTLLSKGFLTNFGNFAVSTTNNGGALTLQPGGGFVKVGGPIAPQVMLEVGRGTGGASLSGSYEIGINSSGRAGFGMIDSTAGLGEFLMGFNSSIESFLIGTVTNHPLFFQSNHVISANLDTNGFLGLGMLTQTPVTRLEVNGITSSTEMSSGRILPHRNNTFDLGSATRSWANIYASGTANLAVVSSTDLFVNGQRVCLSDGTNCTVGETRSASSTATTGLTGTETELLVVTSTLTNVTSTVFISADLRALNVGVVLSTITARIRRGACTTGFQVGVDRIVEVMTTESETLSLSFVDTPATTTAVGYRLCAIGSGGTPQAGDRSMVVEIVKAGADLAEVYYSNDPTVAPGEVVAIDPRAPARVKRSEPNDTTAIGVISTRPGSVLANAADVVEGTPVLLALAGRVPVKVSLENGDILPGDALAPASIPGYVMKATAPGMILGRSLSGFSPDVEGSSRGEALLFIQAGYYVPPALSVQTEQPDESSNGLDQLADPDTDASDTSAEQILSDEGLSTSTENVSTEQGAPTAVADSFDVKGAIDGILDSIKKLFERILGIEAKLEQQQQEIDELRAKIEAIQPQ